MAKKGLNKGLSALLGDALESPTVKKQALSGAVADDNQAGSSNLASRLKALSNAQRKEPKEEVSIHSHTPSDPENNTADGTRIEHITLDLCQRGRYQPRSVIDEESLEELASSIKSQGVIQPITLRALSAPAESGARYEIIAGERRWRAAALAGLDTVPAIVRTLSDAEAVAMALIENLQRDDLNPMEEAYALKRLQEEFDLTHQQVADTVGKSRAAVSNSIRLLSLVKDVKLMLENGDIEMGHARALLGAPEGRQANLAREVVDRGLTVRQTEALVKQAMQPAVSSKPAKPLLDPNIMQLQNDLSEKVGVPVSVQHKANGKGVLTFKYNNLEELDGILDHIK